MDAKAACCDRLENPFQSSEERRGKRMNDSSFFELLLSFFYGILCFCFFVFFWNTRQGCADHEHSKPRAQELPGGVWKELPIKSD